jgi:diguanylate cyclase (GGDEF)-like protein/PAS domain S-box-containing protein
LDNGRYGGIIFVVAGGGALSGSIERYLLAERAGSEGVWDWNLRTDALYLSPRFATFLGLATDDDLYRPQDWLDLVHPDDIAWVTATFEGHALSASSLPFQIEHRVRYGEEAGQPRWRWLACRGVAVLDEAGDASRMVGSVSDITERKKAEQELRLSEERYALAARAANDGLWDWMPVSGEVYYSPRWKDMLGYGEEEIAGTIAEWFDRVLASDLTGLKRAIDLLRSGRRDHLEHEFRVRDASGREIWMLVRGLAVRDESGGVVRIAGSMTDISARKTAEQQLLFDAFHDGLTGLPNRTLLLDRIGQSLDRSRRSGRRPFAVLLLDIDRFKSVNDALGPDFGDRVLCTIATRLESTRRMGDTLAHVSADEFCFLLSDIGTGADAMAAAERLATVVSQPLEAEGRDLVLTASVGIALSVSGYDRPEEMLRDASLAMYEAKSGGRGRIEVFDADLRRQAMAVMRTESDLRTAIEADQLELFYQPIVALASNGIAGFEALVRWRHPERGLVPPAEFIPLAEDSGLILPIGRWVMKEACRQAALWQARYPRPTPLFISVNVSSRQFQDDEDMVALVAQTLKDCGIPPSSLKLEITESLLMDDPARCHQIMRTIRDMDVRLSIDDFGTGYSSLAYLHSFPADTLKIDRSFVQAITSGESSAAIVHVITTLAAILGMDAVAEGIETETEADFLRDIMCKYGQGYFFARPAPAVDMDALLERDAARDGEARHAAC